MTRGEAIQAIEKNYPKARGKISQYQVDVGMSAITVYNNNGSKDFFGMDGIWKSHKDA